jgi:uncharacterized circularly permuted ATP-grasp superfamily protein
LQYFVSKLSFVFLFSISSLSWGQGAEYYNEIKDSSGNIRSWYKDIYQIYQNMNEREVEIFFAQSKKDFMGDNALFPLPRLILDSELQLLRDGVAQRGNALRAFLQDHYSGEKSYLGADIFPKGVLEKIIARYHEHDYMGKLNPQTISFIYGPDIIRKPDGQFAIIEDNIGFVGGIGDLMIAREILFKRIPKYQELINASHDPSEFYRDLVKRWRELANPKGGGIVLWTLPQEERADNEDARTEKILENYGVKFIKPGDGQKLYADKNGNTWFEQKQKNGQLIRKRVGFLFLHAEHKDFEPNSKYNRPWSLLDTAGWFKTSYELVSKADRELKGHLRKQKQYMLSFGDSERSREYQRLLRAMTPNENNQINFDRLQKTLESNPHLDFDLAERANNRPSGVMEEIVAGRLPSSYSPGCEFIGDKEFYIYVEKLIEFYTRQNVIVQNLETRSTATYDQNGRARANPEVIDDFIKNYRKRVAKGVDSRGGDAAYIGPKMNQQELAEVRTMLEANPGSFIVQNFEHLSVLDKYIVDARMLSWVGAQGPVVSFVPWGRGLPIDGDGKVNLSAKGREITIIPVKDPYKTRCDDLGMSRFL